MACDFIGPWSGGCLLLCLWWVQVVVMGHRAEQSHCPAGGEVWGEGVSGWGPRAPFTAGPHLLKVPQPPPGTKP